ncbi:hypothetical protein ABY58_15450 [Edwardsiella ictaluri]|nr:hypothetical protein [Edwardsiella ictaluri]KMQ77299.1 hypothetical protein ABY58_15450 [Edwardsiella ictaluri]
MPEYLTATETQLTLQHCLLLACFMGARCWLAGHPAIGWGTDYRNRLYILSAERAAPLRDNMFYAIYALDNDTIT